MTAPAVTLVPVRDDEFEALFAMFEAYCTETEAYDPIALQAPSSAARRAVLLEGAGQEDWAWIEVDGARAGFVMSQCYEDDPVPGERTAEVRECYVVPEERRRGIGRSAVEAWMAEQRAAGTALVEASVLRDNQVALAFWERLGFVVRAHRTARRP